LSANDRTALEGILREAVDQVLFGVLCVLDGVRAIEPPPKGELRLEYVGPDRSRTMPTGEFLLHEVYEGLAIKH
jgi:hypothetical protein